MTKISGSRRSNTVSSHKCPNRSKSHRERHQAGSWFAQLFNRLYFKLSKNLLVIGPVSFAWLLFRSLSKPSRLRYPCQQMALMQSSLFVGLIAHKGTDFISIPKRLPKSPVKTGLILAAMLVANLVGAEAKQLLTGPVDVNLEQAKTPIKSAGS